MKKVGKFRQACLVYEMINGGEVLGLGEKKAVHVTVYTSSG
jgi:hypothetical protein